MRLASSSRFSASFRTRRRGHQCPCPSPENGFAHPDTFHPGGSLDNRERHLIELKVFGKAEVQAGGIVPVGTGRNGSSPVPGIDRMPSADSAWQNRSWVTPKNSASILNTSGTGSCGQAQVAFEQADTGDVTQAFFQVIRHGGPFLELSGETLQRNQARAAWTRQAQVRALVISTPAGSLGRPQSMRLDTRSAIFVFADLHTASPG